MFATGCQDMPSLASAYLAFKGVVGFWILGVVR